MEKFSLCILFCIIAIDTVSCLTSDDAKDFNDLMNMVNKKRLPERFTNDRTGKNLSPMLGKYSWSSCGTASDLIQIKSLNISPDPLPIPGNITLSASGSLKSNLQSPISVDLEIKKKVVFVWVTVPCVDNVGSCQYNDLCALVGKFKCPPEFKKYGLPCQCPLKAGTYNLPPTSVNVDPAGIPKFLEGGDYKVTVKASYKGQQVLCLNMELSVK